MCGPRRSFLRQREDLLDSPAGERAWRTVGSGGSDPGRPACPSSLKRRSHLYAVARETPTPAAVCAGVQPNSTTRVTTSSLPSGVSFAPGWDVRASSSRLELGNPNPNREALPLSTMSVGITASAAKIQEG